MTKLINFCAVLVLLGAGLAQTDSPADDPDEPLWEPPVVNWATQLPQPTFPDPIISSLNVAEIPIVLDDTPMQDVGRNLKMETGHKGDAGESLRWLCFHGEDNNGRWMFWLESGEIHGGAVGGFQWRSVGAHSLIDSRCRKLRSDQIKLPIQLRLGMSESELRSLLGPPSGRAENLLTFHHEHDEQVEDVDITVWNMAKILLKNGAVFAIEVWHYAVN